METPLKTTTSPAAAAATPATLGTEFNEQELLAALKAAHLISVPLQLTVVSFNSGDMDGTPWAYLEAVDTELLGLIGGMPRANALNTIKISLQNYVPTSLERYVGKAFNTKDFEVVMNSKNGRVAGIKLRTSLAGLV